MSPFSQLSLHGGYSEGIDRGFNSIVNYIDEFDRHFSHRHRFMTCFIPRFDLEEDDCFYYLYGEIPGAKVEEIIIESHDKNSLVIYGASRRPSTRPGPLSADKEYIDHNEHPVPSPTQVPNTENTEDAKVDTADTISGPASAPHHQLPSYLSPRAHFRRSKSGSLQAENASDEPQQSGRRVLLNERLVGNFNRRFTFPTPVVEEAVKASMEDGILSLIIPKREQNGIEKARRIPIMQGKW